MKAVLLDTHTWAWAFLASTRLSPLAKSTMIDADTVWISPVSFFEIAQKVRLGKWPEMAPFIDNIQALCQGEDIKIACPDIAICVRAGSMIWSHRDPFDRLIAATALENGLPLISADTIFDGTVARIW